MANRVEPIPVPLAGAETEAGTRKFTLSATVRKILAALGSYGFLGLGAIFMLFPVFWMVMAATKPTWQITAPDIIIPSFWHKTPGGESLRLVNLWTAPTEDGSGRRDVILYGGRRQYLSMLDANRLGELTPIPRDQAGQISVLAIDDFQFNSLTYNGQTYILVGADGDNLLAVPQNGLDLDTAVVVPRSVQRAAERAEVIHGDYPLPVRQIEVEGKGTLNLIEAGPNIELSTVLPADYAQHAILVPAAALTDKETVPIGSTEADVYTLVELSAQAEQSEADASNPFRNQSASQQNNNPFQSQPAAEGETSSEKYLVIEQAEYRPVIGIDILQQHAMRIAQDEFRSDGATITTESGAVFPVGTYNDQNVALIVSQEVQTGGARNVLVLPVEQLNHAQLILSSSLLEPFPLIVDGFAVRMKDFDHPTVEEENIDLSRMPHQVAILGDRQTMALAIPVSVVTEAYDVFNNDLQRNLTVNFMLNNFVRAMLRETADASFLTFFKNSAVIAAMNIIGHLFSCTIVAYAFARMRAPGRSLLFGIVVATLMMPGFITVIPVYRIFRDLGMVDTPWPLFLRSFFGNAFFIFLMRQFFTTIPMELEEAARIDGANRLQIFFRLMLPLITPALATIVIFTFLGSWNDSFNAVIYLNSPQNYTVAIGLRQFIGQYQSEFNLLMAAAAIVMLPTVLLFFFAQRFFIEGITLTGMKG